MSVPTSEVQSLTPGALVVLYELDATALGDTIHRFHAGVNGLGTDVVWQGNTYYRMPIVADGFEMSSKGVLPRPKIRVAAIDGAMGILVRAYDDLVGAKVTRKRTLAKFIDAVNFPGGTNPTADPTAAFADDVFYVERKVYEGPDLLEFELVSALDLEGLQLPSRKFIRNVCTWDDAGICAYSVGGLCDKTRVACESRWGVNQPLPFGGFLGVSTT